MSDHRETLRYKLSADISSINDTWNGSQKNICDYNKATQAIKDKIDWANNKKSGYGLFWYIFRIVILTFIYSFALSVSFGDFNLAFVMISALLSWQSAKNKNVDYINSYDQYIQSFLIIQNRINQEYIEKLSGIKSASKEMPNNDEYF